MNKRNTIQDELNELNSGLNAGNNGNPYSVPEGYFENLASSVLAKIKGEEVVSATEEIAQLSPLLAGISRSMPYAVPDNYFQSNLESLKAFTSESEESLVLSFIDKEMPYEVPTGYFANLPEKILEKVSDRGAEVVPIKRSNWMRLAVAAMTTGIIAISGITYFNGSHENGNAPVPVNVALKKASTEELNSFIKNTAVVIPDENAPATAKNNPSKTDSKKLFDGVSDKELDAFLNQVPTDDEVDIN